MTPRQSKESRSDSEWRREGYATFTLWEARALMVCMAVLSGLLGILVGYMLWA